MEVLLDIRTVKPEYEMRVRHAKLEMSAADPTHRVTRRPGGLDISSSPPQIKIDTFETRCSMGCKSAARAARESVDSNLRAALEATGQIVRDGNRLADPLSGASVSSLAQERFFSETAKWNNTTVGAIPSVPAQISWTPGSLSMSYTPDALRFDWQTCRPEFTYIPADVEITVKGRPRLEIRYLGKPLYVPPSASPDHEPRFNMLA